NDTDSDSLGDYDEVYLYGTDPANNDTDGDDLADNIEALGLPPLTPDTKTNPTLKDSDGDKLPDGAEVLDPPAGPGYRTNPLLRDTDHDGIFDGDEFDCDSDGLTDGAEFFDYNTTLAVTETATPPIATASCSATAPTAPLYLSQIAQQTDN